MTNNLLILRALQMVILLCLSNISNAQRQDEAVSSLKHLKVYLSPYDNSEVIGRIKANKLFLLAECEHNSAFWQCIEIPKDQNKTSKMFSHAIANNGFVKRSQIIKLDSLKIYTGNDVSSVFTIVAKDIISNHDDKEHAYGYEGDTGKVFVVSNMKLNFKDKISNMPVQLFDDLYNVAYKEGFYSSMNNEMFNLYKHNKNIYIRHSCSDGAAYYQITWVIRNGKIIQRLVDVI